ncbi:GNAT family N-acetyltransferase [Dyella mobilis]|uniref:GNAT family N-acetyltransferase n=1 Tax=Dyella mobilis TaxID=1849582 RepID=A0ABS2KF74_9GAMM|nr:GNAT family protein [Dyella mobilis]MBM7129604.1 GNAT family N-acetyltransferase [Dyella mobilis]GLQ98132.1 hypothetical protein GCM10007863_25520 [Dyella mobilis]
MIALDPISVEDLIAFAKASVPERLAHIALEDALPPPSVATRSLNLVYQGQQPPWCNSFYIREPDDTIIGGCRFKGEPHNGQVEIGYWVSVARRNRGIATRAIEALVLIAFNSGQVREVLAKVRELNAPSTRVVQKLGFASVGSELNHNGEVLVHWTLQIRRLS